MNKIGIGAITLTDVMDGINPIVFQLSNESHTFVADQNGLIGDAEKATFDCFADTYIGETKATYTETVITDDNKADMKSKYNVTVTSTNGAWTSAQVSETGSVKITMDVVPTGTVEKSTTLEVAFKAVNKVGNIVEGTRIISITKGIQGVDGVAVRLEADHNYFLTDSAGNFNNPSDQVTIRIKTIGDVGALTATMTKDGGTATSIDLTQADDDDDGYNDTNLVLKANDADDGTPFFGDSDRVTISVSGDAASTASDVITIARVKAGKKGEAAITVFVGSSEKGTIFKNGSSDTHKKTLTAKAFDMETGNELTADLTYAWKTRNDAGDLVSVYVDDTANVVPADTTDAVVAAGVSIIVGSEDVPDGESAEFTCDVTVGA